VSKLSPLCSVKKRQDFKRVFNKGKYAAAPLFVVYALANEFGENRLGLSVSKKVGGAVVRNCIKRVMRENCRLMLGGQACEQGYDIVIVARVPAGQLAREKEFAQALVKDSLGRLFGKLGLSGLEMQRKPNP